MLVTGAQPGKGSPAEGGGPGASGAAAGGGLPLKLTHAWMDAAVSAGDAVPLPLAGGWLAGYQGAWWVLSEIGWLRVTDDATAADISHVAARLAEVTGDAGGGPPGYGATPPAPDEQAGE
jgi:hypothetical protein